MTFSKELRVVRGGAAPSDVQGADREDPGEPLRKIVKHFESLYYRQDYAALSEAIENNILAAHFGLQPQAFQSMMKAIIQSGADRNGFARGLLAIFSAGSEGGKIPTVPEGVALPYTVEAIADLGMVMKLRLAGRSHEAPVLLDRLDKHSGAIAPIFSDSSGMGIVIPVQAGITAMLAGQVKRAADYFARAQMQPMVPGLPFLTRDAYAKEALVHAAFGRKSDAKRALSQADRIPRLDSWVEPGIDATLELARVFNEADSEAAIERLNSISLHSLGELWPFYVIGLRRVLGRAGRYRELLNRVASFEQMPFPHIPGKGLSGSVFTVARVTAHIATGDLEVARQRLKKADPDYVASKIASIHLELASERFHAALKVAEQVGTDDDSRLWKVDLWRIAGLSSAYLRLGRLDEAREALLLAFAGGLDADDLQEFPDDVLDFAASTIDAWPARDISKSRVVNSVPDSSARLTSREFQVIRMLAQKKTQQEIAEEFYVSRNTIKTHIRAIYRKLDVSSRQAAVLRAEREGWL